MVFARHITRHYFKPSDVPMLYSDLIQIPTTDVDIDVCLRTCLDPIVLEITAQRLQSRDPFNPLVSALLDKAARVRLLLSLGPFWGSASRTAGTPLPRLDLSLMASAS